jgi:hypothetical protein
MVVVEMVDIAHLLSVKTPQRLLVERGKGRAYSVGPIIKSWSHAVPFSGSYPFPLEDRGRSSLQNVVGFMPETMISVQHLISQDLPSMLFAYSVRPSVTLAGQNRFGLELWCLMMVISQQPRKWI